MEDVPAEVVAALDWPPVANWLTALEASPLVASSIDGDPTRPLRLVGSTLYLDRYWRQEQRIATVLDEAALRPAPAVDAARLHTEQYRCCVLRSASATLRLSSQFGYPTLT